MSVVENGLVGSHISRLSGHSSYFCVLSLDGCCLHPKQNSLSQPCLFVWLHTHLQIMRTKRHCIGRKTQDKNQDHPSEVDLQRTSYAGVGVQTMLRRSTKSVSEYVLPTLKRILCNLRTIFSSLPFSCLNIIKS